MLETLEHKGEIKQIRYRYDKPLQAVQLKNLLLPKTRYLFQKYVQELTKKYKNLSKALVVGRSQKNKTLKNSQ